MNLWLVAASAASAATLLLHVIVGGREAAAPLLASKDLRPVARYTNYYCWHLVTIAIAGLGIGFGISAGVDGQAGLTMFVTAMSLLFAVWSLAMIVIHRLRPLHFPQWLIFFAISALGVAGLLA